MVVRVLGVAYVLAMTALIVGLASLGSYVAVSGSLWVGIPLLAVAAYAGANAVVTARWIMTPSRLAFDPDVLRISSPAVLRSEIVIRWADIDLAWLGPRASSISRDTAVLAPLAVPVNAQLRLLVAVSPEARRWAPLLLEPVGSLYGTAGEVPRSGRSYRDLGLRVFSSEALTRLESELRIRDVPVGGLGVAR